MARASHGYRCVIALSEPDFADRAPFAYCGWDQLLPEADADRVLDWLETAPWRLRIEDFYEQHEFSLLSVRPPPGLEALVSEETIANLADGLCSAFGIDRPLALVDVAAHRLTAGQTIRVHNDFLGPKETHRLLVQFNRGWPVENGGLLLTFASQRAEDVADAFVPMHGSAFAFEISPRSFHAVSTIHCGERFTLVYTFRAEDG